MNGSGVRHALFGTLPGRVIVIGVAIRLAVYAAGLALGTVPVFLNVVDTVASIFLAIGAAYFAWKLVALGRRHLLWRVRRKLILSYVFIGFIPAALIVSFFLLSGFLLFYNFSSYLVQSRLRAIGEQAKFLAQSTAIEVQRTGDGTPRPSSRAGRGTRMTSIPGCQWRSCRWDAPAPRVRRVRRLSRRRARSSPDRGRMSRRPRSCRRGSAVTASRANWRTPLRIAPLACSSARSRCRTRSVRRLP